MKADGDGTKEIKRRLDISCKQLINMEKLWKATNNKMKCIFPTATHGFEMSTLNKNITKRINSIENKCYMTILRVSWTEQKTKQCIADEL